jgi:hypothetical protein
VALSLAPGREVEAEHDVSFAGGADRLLRELAEGIGVDSGQVEPLRRGGEPLQVVLEPERAAPVDADRLEGAAGCRR